MKKLLTIMASIILGATPYTQAIAACFDQDSMPDLVSATLMNYDDYAAMNRESGTYELCFDSSAQFPLDSTIVIEVPEGQKLKVTGLNLLAGSDFSNPIITLKGSNIIFDNVKLTGNGSGAAIQVNGTNIKIINSAISNFAEGIKVAANASVELNNNVFQTIAS